MNEEVENQPQVDLSKTLFMVNEILTNEEVCAEVKDHNGWPSDMPTDRVALLFLSARYQDAVEILSARTDFLNRALEAVNRETEELWRWIRKDDY